MVEQQKIANGSKTLQTTDDAESIYTFQQKAMPVLTGWAVGSMVMGIAWWLRDKAWWKGFGSQFAGWGAINALIGIFALRGAASKQADYGKGDISQEEHHKAVRTLEIALWVNALLDVGYMIGGRTLVDNNPDDEQKRGMGWGIIAQGAGLLLWDVILGLILLKWKGHRD